MDNNQLPYGLTQDHISHTDASGNSWFNQKGLDHLQGQMPTQPTIASQLGHTQFAQMQPIQGSPMLSPMLQQGMTTQQSGQPMSTEQAGTIANNLGMTETGSALGGKAASDGILGLIGSLI